MGWKHWCWLVAGLVLSLAVSVGAGAAEKDGATPLHYASASGHVAQVSLLLDGGADAGARKSNGVTPLHVAASEGSIEIVELLLAAGADASAADSLGRTPLSIAREKGHAEIAALLERYSRNAEPVDITAADGWQKPDWGGKPTVLPMGGGGFALSMPAGQAWSAVARTVAVDLDATPILAVWVGSISKGGVWVVKVDNKPYDPAHPCDITPDPAGGPKAGVYFVDLREIGGWRGKQSIEVRLFVTGAEGARVTYSRVALLPDTIGLSARKDGLRSGLWTLGWSAGASELTISRAGSLGEVSVALPVGAEQGSSKTERNEECTWVTVRSASDWGKFETRLTAYNRPAGLFRWSVDAELTKPHAFEPRKPECRYRLPKAVDRLLPGQVSQPERVCAMSRPRVEQQGWAIGNAFAAHDSALGGAVLYCENFTTLTDYFQVEHVSLRETVKANMEEFGYAMPADAQVELPAGTRLRLVDSFLLLDGHRLGGAERAADSVEVCRVYLELMSTIYDLLPHPATVYTDWQDVSNKTLADLMKPECWSNFEKGYLQNYIGEGWGGCAELAVQIDPLVGAKRYERRWDVETRVAAKLTPTLPVFYMPDIHCIVDYATDTKHEKLDAGWIVYMLIQLAHAAEMDIPEARSIVKDSIESVVLLAHKCGYSFPVFYNPNKMDSFEGSAPDCAGAYAYLMLQAHDLFGDQRFLDEARAALDHMAQHRMGLAYEMHATGLSAVACARMYRITGDEKYLKLSYLPVASLIRHCWIWDCRYGFNKEHCTFFGVSCMPGAYIAALEQYRAWLGMLEYEAILRDQLPYDVRNLVSEFLRYGPTVLRYTMPPLMAPGSVAQSRPRGGQNNLSLYIPVEDLYDGWTQHGQTGQEIYGSGGPMTIAAEAFTIVAEAGISVFSEYPVRSAKWSAESSSLTIELAGVRTHESLVAVRYDPGKCGWTGKPAVSGGAGRPVTDRVDAEGFVRLRVAGDGRVVVGPSGK